MRISLLTKFHSFTRCLLSLPGVDIVNSHPDVLWTKGAVACDAPLDIVIIIAKLSQASREDFSIRLRNPTVLHETRENSISAAIFLSWLGFEFEEEDKNCWYSGQGEDRERQNFTEVTLETWREAGRPVLGSGRRRPRSLEEPGRHEIRGEVGQSKT